MLASEGAAAPELTDGARARGAFARGPAKALAAGSRPRRRSGQSLCARSSKPRALVWIADGLEQGGAAAFAAALREAAAPGAGVEVLKDDIAPLALEGAANDSAALEVSVLRAGPRGDGVVEALDDKARLVAQSAVPIRRLRQGEGAFRSADRIAQRGELFARGRRKFRRRRGACSTRAGGCGASRLSEAPPATRRSPCCRRPIISKRRSRPSRCC